MEDISWTDRVNNKYHKESRRKERVKEERSFLPMTKPWKANGIGHILFRYCLIKQVVEEKIEEKVIQRRRLQQLLDDNVVDSERGSTSSTAVDNSLWKRLWIRRNTD